MCLITQFCLILTVIETLISWNCNLPKILPTNYISNYTRAYNCFELNRYELTVVICSKISVTRNRL